MLLSNLYKTFIFSLCAFFFFFVGSFTAALQMYKNARDMICGMVRLLCNVRGVNCHAVRAGAVLMLPRTISSGNTLLANL